MSDRPAFDAGQTGRASSAPAFARSGQQVNQRDGVIATPTAARASVPSVVTEISAAASAAAASIEQVAGPADESAVASSAQEQNPLRSAVTRLNDYVQSVQRDLEFSFDEESGHSVITVIDRNTKEVVRQLPDDLALELARNLQNNESMRLLDARI
ncbi:flagellar protein FlaG [Allohahella marinimesophila]|uniref:Flagellar protein FlaG n=1 Tax=Allohahella marinimesophila TaxID=1054972 RepID=A0ABP7NUH0_9GAMM